MNAEQLRKILNEYPPSRKLVIIVDGARVLETTVLEVLLKLMEKSQPALLTFFGRESCIIRERIGGERPNAPYINEWLEIDLR